MSGAIDPDLLSLIFGVNHLVTLLVEVVVVVAIAVAMALRPSPALAVLGLAAVLRTLMTLGYLVAMVRGMDMVHAWPTLIAVQVHGLASVLLGGLGLVWLLVDHVRRGRRDETMASNPATATPFK